MDLLIYALPFLPLLSLPPKNLMFLIVFLTPALLFMFY